jgi:hypothetical protein
VVWAKWVLGILSIIGGIFGIVASLRLVGIAGGVVVLIMGLLYVFAGTYVLVTVKKQRAIEESL